MAENPLTVLIVDDNVEIVETLADLLGRQGYVVKFAHSGNDAVQLLESAWVDVVISDIMMANGNGLKVRDCARSLGIPFIFSTGHAGPYEPAIGNEVVLEKPLDRQRLLDLLERVDTKRTLPPTAMD